MTKLVGYVVGMTALAACGNICGEIRPDFQHHVAVTSSTARAQLGASIPFAPTDNGRHAAGLLLKALDERDLSSAKAALSAYRQMIPVERYGGDYTALAWFCEYLLASRVQRKGMLADPYTENWFQYLARDRFSVLKEYLQRKYRLGRIKDRETEEGIRRESDLTDFVLFGNPRREEWEKTSRMLGALGIRNGDVVADIGCGPGYHSCMFAKLVGPAGKVYAVDVNGGHLEFLDDFTRKAGISNVVTVVSQFDDICVTGQVDVAFLCSLYHYVYGGTIQPVRDRFVESIRRVLPDGGRLVVADNAVLEGDGLPYHGPRIAPDLVAAQFKFYGFRLTGYHQFIPQRYVLVFEKTAIPSPEAKAPVSADADIIAVKSKASLVYQRGPGTMDAPEGCVQAARLFLAALEKNDRGLGQAALDAYRKAIPASKRGSEYTGAQWFCEYWLASAAERKAMVTDPYTDDYVQCFTDRKCALLKEYLKRRFGLVRFRHEAQQKADWRHSYLHEFMETLNPWREEWEKADKVMSLMDFKSGQTVADIGSGPGFYTFRFARAVGPHGKVYAVDINDEHLAYVSRTARKFGVHQVESVNSGSGEIGITNRVDTVFLCGVYTAIYSGMPDNNRKEFIETIRTMLKPDGRLVVVDTPLVEGDIPFFYSPYTAKELVAAQLKHYGFRLVADHPIIPERYLMIFRKAELPGKPAVVPQRR